MLKMSICTQRVITLQLRGMRIKMDDPEVLETGSSRSVILSPSVILAVAVVSGYLLSFLL
ncbi:MAG: hypothetical protein Aurels2KO_55040 [Aureliella sp.]